MKTRHLASGAAIVMALLLTIACSKKSPEGFFSAGVAYAEKGSWQKAIDAYTNALEAKPDWADAYVNRGVARHELGQYKEALSDYDNALAVDDANVNAYRNRALAFKALGDLPEAIDDYSTAIRLDVEDVEIYRGRAEIQRELKDEDAAAVDDALAELTSSIASSPKNAVPHSGRGLAFFELGEYELAMSDLSEAIRLAPENADTYVARAHVLFIQGEYDRAIKDYTHALDRNVKSAAEAYAGRGNAYESVGNIPKAVADYSEAVRLDPNDEETMMQLAWILATHPAAQLRNGQRALELSKRAVELTDGRHWRSLDVMAAAYAETGDFAGAVKYAQLSLNMSPEDQLKAVAARLSLYRSGKSCRETGE